MGHPELKDIYQSRAGEFSSRLERDRRKYDSNSRFRIQTAISFIVLIFLGNDYPWLYLLLPILAFLFVYLVSLSTRYKKQIRIGESLLQLNQLESKSLGNDTGGFYSGERYQSTHHPYSYDLDLFGEGSVFQSINRCGTRLGEDKLAADLQTPLATADHIYSRQSAIQEVASLIDFRQDIWAHASLRQNKREVHSHLSDWLKAEDIILGKRFYEIILVVFPLLTLGTGILLAIDMVWSPLFLFMTVLQYVIASYHGKKVTYVQQVLGNHRGEIEQYSILLKRTSQEQFHTPYWKTLQGKAKDGADEVKKFFLLVNALESRMNMIVTIFGNTLFLFDLQRIIRLERWRKKNTHSLQTWMETVAETDALSSWGTFQFNHPRYSFPVIGAALSIRAEEMGHPLIPAAERVNNEFVSGSPQRILIITGANMAGKSTYLRSVGVNLVLALAGSPVCARSFVCPLIHLRSGMRTSDSLQEHQSYFFAELNRLQHIMEELKQGKPLLILLDEILKGTNSNDKQAGSIALVKRMLGLQALVVLATHDVTLGELEHKHQDQIINYCFESEVVDGKLHFDYLIKRGVSQKANATFLMKQMGIILE